MSDQAYAPLVAHSEGVRIALLHGVDEAIEWVRMAIGQSGWTTRPDWGWWPLNGLLVLLEARAGRVAAARSLLHRVWLPAPLMLTARAAVEIADGQIEAALGLTDQVLSLEDVTNTWRLLATGIRLACLPDSRVPSEKWGNHLDVVVLLPGVAQRLLIPFLQPETAQLEGLAGVGAAEPEAVKVSHLTPRQLEVLSALGRGGTMNEVAAEMFLSVETVRSTAKEVYRRLGVHDRETAVQVGRAQGLI